MNKTVSVVIPTYNRGRLIKRAIESVQTQTYPAIHEIIIVDDGSTDNTREVVYAVQDSRIRYVKLEGNHGAGYARNRGAEISTGDYLAYCDSDDYWKPEKLAIQIQYMEETKADMCFHAIERRFATGVVERIPEGFPSKAEIGLSDIIPVNKASTQTFLLTQKCAKTIQFDEELPSLEDWEFAVRLCAQGFRVSYLDEVLCIVERQSDSISNNMENGFWAMNKILVQLIGKYNEVIRKNGTLSAEVSEIHETGNDPLQNALNIIHEMENSTSWRITAPIRHIKDLIKKK